MADELDVLLERVSDEALRRDLAAHISKLRQKRQFGLVFEEHLPELVALPQHEIRRGTKVVGRGDNPGEQPRVVLKVSDGTATLAGADDQDVVSVAELVAVAEFGEPIYPGLRRLGSIDRGGDKPAHVVIKGENYHALEALQFTHAGQVDCIYIDPPYNTGARDWKYNNDYVDGDDAYRHSKWLAMMRRRLLLAKRLLNPDDSVLIVTIDEKEYLRLGLLLGQTFPDAGVQMVSTLINPAAVARAGAFGRSDEYIFFVTVGGSAPQRVTLSREWVSAEGRTHKGVPRWDMLRRSGEGATRQDSPGCFYPIYIDPGSPKVVSVGEALPAGTSEPDHIDGLVAVLPIRKDGTEGRWQWQPKVIRERILQGRVRITGDEKKGFVVSILKDGEYTKILNGEFEVSGHRKDGSILTATADTDTVLAVPGTQWRIRSHDATQYGSRLLADSLLPGRKFPFPKSLYAVEDTIRFFVNEKPNAVIVDFFAGSGTTAHAVARLNRQDGGQRHSISVTNNEVSSGESKRLAEKGLRPGDSEWEALGIFEHITRPRIEAAMTGVTPHGEPVKGGYKFTDEFSMAEGLDENVEFVELEYLDAESVQLDRAFAAVAPLLWMRAGSLGPILSESLDSAGGRKPYLMSNRYAVLFNPDRWRHFVEKLASTVSHVFVVTDSASVFTNVAAELPEGVQAVRLYENYLSTFAINTGAAAP